MNMSIVPLLNFHFGACIDFHFRGVVPLLNGSASVCFSSFLLVFGLTFHFVKISQQGYFS